MELQEFIQIGFLGLISYILRDVTVSIKELKNSVIELNVKMAVIVSQVQSHDKRIEKLESN